MKKNLLFFIFLFAIVSSCSDDNFKEPEKPQENDHAIQSVSITNNPSDLSSRVTYSNELVVVKDIDTGNTKSVKSDFDVDPTKNYAFKLRAQVDAPRVQGEYVQATHVKIVDDMAFVTYNTKGPEYNGGVELFNIADKNTPILQAQAMFHDVDVSAVDYYNGKLYLAGAHDMDAPGFLYESPAILIELEISPSGQILLVSNTYDIASYVATDVKVDEDYIYVTSGSDGKLTVLNHNFTLAGYKDINEARSVAINSEHVYVLEGSAASPQLQKFGITDLSGPEFIGLNGPVTAESKTEIDVTDNLLLAALNEGGLDIRELNGDLKEHIERPATPEGELDEDFVTNSVALNDELLLIGNGGAGLYVGAIIPEIDDEVLLMGSMDFDASVNFVESKENCIFVAAGTGGLKILSIEIDEGIPDDIIPTKPCPTLVDNIIAMFPAGKDNRDANSDLFADGNNLILKLQKESPVYLTFIDEGAGWRNSLAYYTYDADNPPTGEDEIELHMLFPNVSKEGEGGGLTPGDRVQLGDEAFPENTVIGFCLIAKGWKNGATTDGIYRHYTNVEFNEDDNQQHVLFIEQNCKDIVLCFEDIQLPNGDKDYNDIIFAITDNEEDNLVATAFDTENIIEK
ncbi:DUF4114 domain-containing protein [Marinifilum caeruleilacunae]|uniref:DUF4114 domain-containing protein n=1 Tax=Marinifilum caeruleilacunae TaxID=2499076 RepID=A0ABX1WWR0_9BACT|nr:DUF4114 domain-containing protein [Marinifilum caeruleilacunae]NOU60565.1 DUF4114 domain-containing protein [Marinifilum caeruleilacunae]